MKSRKPKKSPQICGFFYAYYPALSGAGAWNLILGVLLRVSRLATRARDLTGQGRI